MKTIDFSNPGGLDFGINDVQFIYNALREAIIGSASWLDGLSDVVIISGCVITEDSGNYTHTAGWIYQAGELYLVPALDTPTPLAGGLNYVFNYVENEAIEEGSQIAEDSSPADTWLVNYATIIRSDSTSHQHLDSKRIGEMFKAAMQESEWRAASTENSWAGTNFKYKLDRFGEVIMSGRVDHAALGAGQTTITTLSEEYRPSENKEFIVSGYDKAGGSDPHDFVKIIVATDGKVSISTNVFGAAPKRAYMHTIHYRI